MSQAELLFEQLSALEEAIGLRDPAAIRAAAMAVDGAMAALSRAHMPIPGELAVRIAARSSAIAKTIPPVLRGMRDALNLLFVPEGQADRRL